MSTVITRGGIVIIPTYVDEYAAEETLNTIVHPILGRRNPDITRRPAELRTGTLRLTFAQSSNDIDTLMVIDGIVVHAGSATAGAELASKEAADAHVAGGTFTLTSTSLTTIAMLYEPVGSVQRTLDPKFGRWFVEVGFQEVLS